MKSVFLPWRSSLSRSFSCPPWCFMPTLTQPRGVTTPLSPEPPLFQIIPPDSWCLPPRSSASVALGWICLPMEVICYLRAGLGCHSVPQPGYGVCFLYIWWLTRSLENSAPWPSMQLGPGLSQGGCATRHLELEIKQSSEQVSICKTKTSWN